MPDRIVPIIVIRRRAVNVTLTRTLSLAGRGREEPFQMRIPSLDEELSLDNHFDRLVVPFELVSATRRQVFC